LSERSHTHIPVLCEPILERLEIRPDAIIVDATVGEAGHARRLAQGLNEQGRFIGFDVDEKSLVVARANLQGLSCQVDLIRENFGCLDIVLKNLGLEKVSVILADIGVSSAQLADPERGISFQNDGPLDMRMDERLETTAAELVNGLDQKKLADVIWRLGEERLSRRIAKGIVEARRQKSITRTGELVDVIFAALGIRSKGYKSRINPATRTFQALRIAVNDELGQLERLLRMAPNWLEAGGQIAIISFHSLEDRIVKYDFREKKSSGDYEIETKKPIIALEEERRANPRSRSAKLRIARRI
jgi:16S rRNA (cytosine1402-N4)-methyltransferase